MKYSLFSLAVFILLPLASYAEVSAKISTTTQNSATTPQALKILYQQNFAQQKTIPQGWRIPGNNAGHIYIENGVLNIDGRANPLHSTSVLLPQHLEKQQNYRIDVEFSLAHPVNPSRWGSVMYDVTETQGVIPSSYYQFTMRAATTAQNGTEFARRKSNAQWDVISNKAFSENLKPNQWYKASIVVSGQRVQHYLNQQLMQDIELDQISTKGGIGLSVAGAVLRVRNIQVSEQIQTLAELPNKVIQVQEIQSNVALAPTIIQKMEQNQTALNSANQVYYQLDAKLNLFDQKGKKIGALQDYLINPQRKTIPVLEITEPKVLEQLKLFSNKQDISDITLLSKSEVLLKTAHQVVPMLRTALDLSTEKLKHNRLGLSEIIRRTNQAYARIVVLPADFANKASVSFIQRHLMTVWMDSTATQPHEVATVLTSGVNGVMTTQSALFSSVLKQFPKNTLLRKPFIIGHRGVPSLDDENTLESAKHAVVLGADIVENDIYLTKDQHIVVMHDATVDRTTTSTGKIEEMTLAQVQQLRSKHKNYKIPTLAEYFIAFKNNPNFVLMIEMKSKNPQLVAKMQEQIKKYQVENQVVITSFNRDQVMRAQTQLSEIPRGLLVGKMPTSSNVLINTKQINTDVQKFNSSYNPAYRSDLGNILDASKHRGMSFWPWALSDETFKKLYIAGTHGITTNSAQLYSKYIVDIHTAESIKVKQSQPVHIKAQLIQQDGTQLKQDIHSFMVLSGSPKYVSKNGQLIFLDKGTAYVLVAYKYQIDPQNFYHIFSKPVLIDIK